MKIDDFCPGELNRDNMPMHMLLFQIVHLHKQYVINLMKPTGLQMSQMGILAVLKMNGPMSQREIADKIHVTPPSVTVALQKLEKLGYIERRTDEKDQRIMRIMISESGRKLVDETKSLISETEEMLFEGMSAEEKMLLRRLILQMRDNLLASRGLEKGDISMHHADGI